MSPSRPACRTKTRRPLCDLWHLAAWLEATGRLAAGETLCVLGAAGGTGLSAVEIGALMGARVIACASSDDKLALAREHGAHEAFNYETENFSATLKR